ncbi:MAG: hypothetical protein PHY47_11545 [Lachnospiraceae bacterium]|nr:hypothetical protein [Lachnospiraceae bacterium]
MNDPTGEKRVETEERLEYDVSTDTLTHISRHQDYDGKMFDDIKVFCY